LSNGGCDGDAHLCSPFTSSSSSSSSSSPCPSPSPSSLPAQNVKSSTITNGNHHQQADRNANPPPNSKNAAPEPPKFKAGPLSRKPWEYEKQLENIQLEDIIYDSFDEESDDDTGENGNSNKGKQPNEEDDEEGERYTTINKSIDKWTSCIVCQSDVLSHKLASHVMKYHLLKDFHPKICHIESCSKCLPNYDGMLIIPTHKMKLKIPKLTVG